MNDVVGLFITWTCYGSRLPGDERGWIQWHKGWHPSNLPLKQYSRSIMTEDAVVLTQPQRQLVEVTIVDHCAIRKWHLWEKNPRSTHVHVVVTAREYAPEIVRDQLKAWCTRRLKEQFDRTKKNWWAEGGCIRKIESEEDLEAAILYTRDAQ